MKKTLLPVLAVVAMFVSCGPSAEETAKREEYKKDSITAMEKQVKDQLDQRLKEMQDSITAVAKATNEKMEDQVNQVKDQMAKENKATKKELDRIKKEDKKKEEETKPENVKAGQGKG